MMSGRGFCACSRRVLPRGLPSGGAGSPRPPHPTAEVNVSLPPVPRVAPTRFPLRALGLGAVLLAGLLAARGARAQENSDCLSCHSDATLTKKKAGRTVSLFVDEKRLKGSVHADAPCVGCHSDLSGKELPHDEKHATPTCDACHGDIVEQYAQSLHGKAVKKGDAAGASLLDLPRQPRHREGQEPVLPGPPGEDPVPLRQVPPGGHAGPAPARHPAGPDPRELHREHPRRGPPEEGPVVAATCVSCHTAHLTLPAHRPALLDRPAEHREDLRRRATRTSRASTGR